MERDRIAKSVYVGSVLVEAQWVACERGRLIKECLKERFGYQGSKENGRG